MPLITKINNVINIKKPQPKAPKEIANQKADTKSSNNNLLTKSLLALAIAATPLLPSCVVDEPNNKTENIGNNLNDSIPTIKNAYSMSNAMLDSLGLLLEPANSIDDVRSISFKDDKKQKYFLQPLETNTHEVFLKVTEINPKRSDFLKNIRLTESRIGLKAELFFNNGKTQESHLQFAQNGIVEYIYENGCLIENSKFIKNNDNTITQIFTNGESRTFDNIKNNEALPDKITFDPSVEPWNDETCQ